MISSILIANRGEIAVRIVRACKELGIRSVTAFSEADRYSLAVQMSDEAVCIGPAPSKDSYLNTKSIISAAVLSHCDAVHPGVGFLSENAQFAQDVCNAGIIFIGPNPETIQLLGNKIEAKHIAVQQKVPVIPGIEGAVNIKDAAEAARSVGFPVIVKASAGGGGKGMRICEREKDIAGILQIASAEAEKAFSDGTLYLEKYLESPRHVEFQIIGDGHGNVIHLGERDCSVQDNHQKLIEESPSTAVDDELRSTMAKDTVRLFSSLQYCGAGTIEFLVQDGRHYFMEVNARVQVEHPVTEMVSGVDIIAEQIRAVSEGGISVAQKDIHLSGYAVECRVNAQAPGTITHYYPPGGPGVRVDSFLYSGAVVPPFYDSLIAKLIVSANNRQEGLARMSRALSEFEIQGIPTNLDLQKKIIHNKVFQSGKFGTNLFAHIQKEKAE